MKILVIGYVWPEPKSSAAGARMLQLLDYFLSKNDEITFATTAAPTLYMTSPELKGITTVQIELNSSSFDDFITKLLPDVVLFDRFMMEEQFGWRVASCCPNALRILDTEDLHFLRQHREISFKAGNAPVLKRSELAKREIASIYRCDLSLIISREEMKLLTRVFSIPENLLCYLPFLYDEITDAYARDLPAYEEREHFITIGNFKHAPNVDAAIYLKNEIWPLIRKELPDVEMHVYGAYPTARINELHKPSENFIIQGRTEDAPKVVKNARVVLAPLRFGAGLKGKLAEAMLCGTPSVTTPVGAEGMHENLPWNGCIEEKPAEFAMAACALYTSQSKWKEAQQQGFKIINSCFSKDYFYKSFSSGITQIKKDLPTHRDENFTGGMLMHHLSRSTYFLSKYIEIKGELEKQKEVKNEPPYDTGSKGGLNK